MYQKIDRRIRAAETDPDLAEALRLVRLFLCIPSFQFILVYVAGC